MVPVSMTLSDLTHISRLLYYSSSHNSKMVQDRAIVTLADGQKVVYITLYRTAPFSMILNDP